MARAQSGARSDPHSRQHRLRARADVLRRLAGALEKDCRLTDLLAQSASPQPRALLVRALEALLVDWELGPAINTTELFSDLVEWISTNRSPPLLSQAVLHYRSQRNLNRRIHRFVVENLGLHRTAGKNLAASLPRHYLQRLDIPYPPLGEHIVESDTIDALWRYHLEQDPLPDSRQTRRPLHRLDPTSLMYTVEEDESCVLIDKDDGTIIAIILRGIAGEEGGGREGFLAWARKTIMDGIEGRRSVRKEDPGKMIQAGYTAGSRSHPSFNWVRNLLRQRELSPEFVASSDYEASCLFAVLWNIIRACLPGPISDDWVEFLRSNQLPCMDAGVGMAGNLGDYHIHYGDHMVTFFNAELAPPTGLLNFNYSRAIHFERQPHVYSVQWILGRTHDKNHGGHFYISSHGVRIVNAADTLIAWRPMDEHGTSLAAFDPYDPDPEYVQVGVCFCTSQRLATVYQRYDEVFKEQHEHHVADGGGSFGKRWTAEDVAAEAAAKEFISQIVAGILEDSGTSNFPDIQGTAPTTSASPSLSLQSDITAPASPSMPHFTDDLEHAKPTPTLASYTTSYETYKPPQQTITRSGRLSRRPRRPDE